MTRRELAVISCILGILLIAIAPEGTFAVPDRRSKAPQAEGVPAGITVGDTGGMAANPQSDLIFRATGATKCLDCHRTGKEGQVIAQVQDNALVQELKAKAKGIHGPGRFADCLRCHAGGNKGVEKYRK